MNLLATPLAQSLVSQIGWTLVHFLWQGTIVAALLFLILHALRHRSAQSRHLAACFALLLMAGAPVATFVSLDAPQSLTRSAAAPAGGAESLAPAAPLPSAPHSHLTVTRSNVWTDFIAARVGHFLPALVLCWVAGVGLLTFRLLAGWTAVRRLARQNVRPIPGLEAQVNSLRHRLGIRRAIAILESSIVEIPSVVGSWKPVILLPASALTGLSPIQLECVLLHELAHIRRHDPLVNLLQCLVETVLFFHPLVWWVSRQIRIEREYCCDDHVIALTRNRTAYAHALASLEELRPPAALALAATGASLVQRVRRILGQPGEIGASPGWLPAILVFALTAACLFVNQAQAIDLHPSAAENLAVPSAHNAEALVESVSDEAVTEFFVLIEAQLAEVPEEIARRLGILPKNILAAAPSNLAVTSVLAPSQAADLKAALRTSPGIDFLSAPRLTTASGREAQIAVLQAKTIISGVEFKDGAVRYVPQRLNVGPSIQLIPVILSESRQIELDASCELTEFLGYDKSRTGTSPGGGEYETPKPIIRTRELRSKGVLLDGHTLVFAGAAAEHTVKTADRVPVSGDGPFVATEGMSIFHVSEQDRVPVLGDVPFLGRMFRSKPAKPASTVSKHLVVLLTASLIDAEGRRVPPPSEEAPDENPKNPIRESR